MTRLHSYYGIVRASDLDVNAVNAMLRFRRKYNMRNAKIKNKRTYSIPTRWM